MQHTIDYLRRQAKTLKRAFAAGDPDARSRVLKVFPDAAMLRHTQSLHVIAREEGFGSWPKLKFAHELVKLDRDAKAERLKMALYLGQNWIVDSILSVDPDIANANLGLQVALYRVGAVADALAHDPGAATRLVGVRSPMLHLAFSKHHQTASGRDLSSVEVAELLVHYGADVNDSYPAEPESDHRLSALYGALGHAGNLVLAQWLLEHGADPDDDESLYHATELETLDGVRLLMKHRARTSGTNALPRMLDFDNLEGVELLLEYGADPNEAVSGHPSGQPVDSIPGLHQAARRGRDGRFADLLLAHGADPSAIWEGRTPYALAAIYGNRSFADALAKAGHAAPLSKVDHVLASCGIDETPKGSLSAETLDNEARRILTRVILWEDRLDHAKALVAAGIDPNQTDEMGMTPLHLSAWAGLKEQTAWLLSLDPDLMHVNRFGGGLVGTIIHGSENRLDTDVRDHVGCLRLALDAGASVNRADVDGAMQEDVLAFLRDWAETHPGRVADTG